MLRAAARRSFTVLALESSADDTCAAIVNSQREILANVVVKQNAVHEGYGGIHPYHAINAHQANMPGAVRTALDQAHLSIRDIDGIAYTRGPGIGGCLSVGSNAAKSLAAALNAPCVGVHHMQAHALTPFLTSAHENAPQFPFLTLLISGGHTLLLLTESVNRFKTIATTSDESIGRVFDKVSRMLGLKWTSFGPGAALEQFCAENSTSLDGSLIDVPSFPRPMARQLAFSYSGLHSTVERFIFTQGGINEISIATKRTLARAFQTAAVAQLEEKLGFALDWCDKEGISVNDLVVSGGVASNTFLRHRLQAFLQSRQSGVVNLVFPPATFCTDNAAMIAWASMHRFLAGDYDDYALDLRPKWDIEDL